MPEQDLKNSIIHTENGVIFLITLAPGVGLQFQCSDLTLEQLYQERRRRNGSNDDLEKQS